ncbi:hypothetical protein ACS0TY_034821 [Phlomoides rotata]
MGNWDNGTWVWDWKWSRTLSHHNISFFNDMLQMVNRLQLNQFQEDEWRRLPGKDGLYSTRKNYQNLAKLEDRLGTNRISRTIGTVWRSFAARKALLMAWRTLHKRLPTRENLLHRSMISASEALCSLCSKEIEYEGHLFLQCPVASWIWQNIYDWIGISTATSLNMEDHFLHHTFLCPGDESATLGITLWIGVVWNLWKLRNDVVFNGGKLNLEKVIGNIKICVWTWMKAKGLVDYKFSFSSWLGDPFNWKGI